MQEVKTILEEIANGATIRRQSKLLKLNKQTLSGQDIVRLNSIQERLDSSIEIRRSGTGLVIIVTVNS